MRKLTLLAAVALSLVCVVSMLGDTSRSVVGHAAADSEPALDGEGDSLVSHLDEFDAAPTTAGTGSGRQLVNDVPDEHSAAGIEHAVELRFVDAYGGPVAGVEVATMADRSTILGSSAADGSVNIVVSLDEPYGSGHPFQLQARHPEYTSRQLPAALVAGATLWLGDVTLLPGGSVRGTLELPGGKGAELHLLLPGTVHRVGRRSVTQHLGMTHEPSAEDGSFRIDGIEPGDYAVAALSPDSFTAVSDAFRVAAGQVTELGELKFTPRAPEDSIQGRVLDASGRPVAEARLSWQSYGWRGKLDRVVHPVEVEPDGSFEVDLVAHRSVHLVAWSLTPHLGRVEKAQVVGSARAQDLILPTVRTLEVLVRDEQGSPARDARVSVAVHQNPAEASPGIRSTRKKYPVRRGREYEGLSTDEEGRLRLPEPWARYRISVGHGDLVGSATERDPGVSEPTITIELVPRRARPTGRQRKPQPVLGRVLLDGHPVEGAEVSLRNASPPSLYKRSHVSRGYARRTLYRNHRDQEAGQAQLQTQPFAVFCPGDGKDFTTDAKGEFRGNRFDTTVYSRNEWVMAQATWKDYASPLYGPFPFDQVHGEGRPELNLELLPTGSIVGTVLPPAGTSVTGIVVGASRGDGTCRTTTTGPTGEYRLEGLPTGDWQVRACPRSLARDFELSAEPEDAFHPRTQIRWDCRVAPSTATRFDLDLRNTGTTRLTGSVEIDGLDADGWSVRVLSRDGPAATNAPALASTRIAGDQSFEIELFSELPVWLEVSAPMNQFMHWTPVDLVRGSNHVSVQMRTGKLVWNTPDARMVFARWESLDGSHGQCSPSNLVAPTNATFAALPAGKIHIMRRSGVISCFSAAPNEFRADEPRQQEELSPEEQQFLDSMGDAELATCELKPGQTLVLNAD